MGATIVSLYFSALRGLFATRPRAGAFYFSALSGLFATRPSARGVKVVRATIVSLYFSVLRGLFATRPSARGVNAWWVVIGCRCLSLVVIACRCLSLFVISCRRLSLVVICRSCGCDSGCTGVNSFLGLLVTLLVDTKTLFDPFNAASSSDICAAMLYAPTRKHRPPLPLAAAARRCRPPSLPFAFPLPAKPSPNRCVFKFMSISPFFLLLPFSFLKNFLSLEIFKIKEKGEGGKTEIPT